MGSTMLQNKVAIENNIDDFSNSRFLKSCIRMGLRLDIEADPLNKEKAFSSLIWGG